MRLIWVSLTAIFCCLIACAGPSTIDSAAIDDQTCTKCTPAQGLASLGINACKEACKTVRVSQPSEEQALGAKTKALGKVLRSGLKKAAKEIDKLANKIKSNLKKTQNRSEAEIEVCDLQGDSESKRCDEKYDNCVDSCNEPERRKCENVCDKQQGFCFSQKCLDVFNACAQSCNEEDFPDCDNACEPLWDDCYPQAVGREVQCGNREAREELVFGDLCTKSVANLKTECESEKTKCISSSECRLVLPKAFCDEQCENSYDICIVESDTIEAGCP